MILKIEGITGMAFAKLVAFVHSDDNYLMADDHMSPRVVKIKNASSNAEGMYALDLDILDRYDSTRWEIAGGFGRVESLFVTQVYEILISI
jgi:hypothetical protein